MIRKSTKTQIEYLIKIYAYLLSPLLVFLHLYLMMKYSQICVYNGGLTLGLFSTISSDFLGVLSVIVLILILISIILVKESKIVLSLCMSVIFAGLGNLIDRIVNRGVCDYFSINFFKNIGILKIFFNLNDIIIGISLFLVLLFIVYERKNSEKS